MSAPTIRAEFGQKVRGGGVKKVGGLGVLGTLTVGCNATHRPCGAPRGRSRPSRPSGATGTVEFPQTARRCVEFHSPRPPSPHEPRRPGRRTGIRRPVAEPDPLARLSDEDLLTRFRKGHRDVFGTLVRRYQRELYGYLRRYLGDAHMADDVFQTTFVQVFAKAAQYEPGRPVRSEEHTSEL